MEPGLFDTVGRGIRGQGIRVVEHVRRDSRGSGEEARKRSPGDWCSTGRVDTPGAASYYGPAMGRRERYAGLRPGTSVWVILGIGATLLLLSGCRWPWAKKEEAVPKGRIIESAVDYYEMGRNLEIHGNYPSAIDKYRESIEISPRPMAYFALGSLQAELLEFDEGKENLEKALELSPGFGAARRELDRVEAVEKLMLRGEPVPEDFRKKPIPPSLLEEGEEPGEPESVSTAKAPPSEETIEEGEVAPEVGLEKVETVPEKKTPVPPPSIMEEPSAPDLTAQEVPSPAETLSKDEEVEVRAYLREASILLKDGKLEEAIQLYQEALLEFPRVGRIYSSLGYAYQLAGNSRAALLAYEDALRFGDASPELYNNLGVTYESIGQSRLAEKAYRKAIDMTGFPDAHYNLAVLLEKRGDLDEALLQFEAYVALDPSGQYAEKARARAERLRRRAR